MIVKELMSPNVMTIGVDDHCLEAATRMVRNRIRHLPVVDRDGAACGIVTDRDLRHHLFDPEVFAQIGRTSLGTILRAQPVRAVMSAPVICVAAVADVEEATRLMRAHRIGAVPVLDTGRVVGILTETDLLRHVVRADAMSMPEVDVIVVSYP